MKRAAILVVVLFAGCGVDSTTGPAATTPSLSAPPVPALPIPAPPRAPQVFVGAGDIGLCGSPGQALTASLLGGIAGTVFTLGDNAYPSGSARDFRDCYDPNWGRHKSRTRPVPGNHEYETPGATPYSTTSAPTPDRPAWAITASISVHGTPSR